MKNLFFLGLLMLVSAFALTALARPAVPADGLKMELTKKSVTFDHSVHEKAGIDCSQCHHKVKGEEHYEKCSTAGCHDNLDQKDKSVNSYYQAMHKFKDNQHASCVSCHREKAGDDKDKKKAMTACAKSSCHP